MEKKELLKYCKFYKGEKSFPESLMSKTQYAFLFWEAEQVFCEDDPTTKRDFIQLFLDAGLTAISPSIPTFLAASLFVCYNKYSDNDLMTSVAYFKERVMPAYVLESLL